jgi:hypothetical protein
VHPFKGFEPSNIHYVIGSTKKGREKIEFYAMWSYSKLSSLQLPYSLLLTIIEGLEPKVSIWRAYIYLTCDVLLLEIKVPRFKCIYNIFANITNLTSYDLVMEIMQNSFIHNFYISHIDIMHWKHIWHTYLEEDKKFVWHLFIYSFILHLLTHLSTCQTCFEHMIFVCKPCQWKMYKRPTPKFLLDSFN